MESHILFSLTGHYAVIPFGFTEVTEEELLKSTLGTLWNFWSWMGENIRDSAKVVEKDEDHIPVEFVQGDTNFSDPLSVTHTTCGLP